MDTDIYSLAFDKGEIECRVVKIRIDNHPLHLQFVLALFGEYGVFQYDSLREVVASGICDGVSIDVCYYLQVGICGVEDAELKPVVNMLAEKVK